jgi:predicted DNA-binding protein (MmcQ/YjbR family)
MNIEEVREFALALEHVTEGTPFGVDVLVFKVKEKMFLLLPLTTDTVQFNVKCDPEEAIQLREQYPDTILPGYHMSKKHWNTVIVDGVLTTKQLKEFIQASYELVKPAKKLKEKK